jgi:hypothetical protein
MTPPQYLLDIAEWSVNCAFWSSITFTVLITPVWPWWKSFWGVNIISLEIAISLALLGSVLETDFGLSINPVLLLWITASAVWLVAGIITWRGFLVLSAQLQGTFGVGIRGAVRRLARREKLQQIQPTAAGGEPEEHQQNLIV